MTHDENGVLPEGEPLPTQPDTAPIPTPLPNEASCAPTPPDAGLGLEEQSDDPADIQPDVQDSSLHNAAAQSATEHHETDEVTTPAQESGACRSLGVRLRKAGQVFFIPDTENTVRIGSKVVVETEHGTALGKVEAIFHGPPPPDTASSETHCGKIVGLATAQDIARHTENAILAAEASAFCKTCIRQRELDMKLVDVEVLHDRSKIIFFFTAPARIDFRELVKDLVRNYRTRIELRQIGVRHETQMIGGLGNCGSVCCCHTYLRKFAPVTIKMAKEQNLFLNPAKLSGMCGRLLCCLSFEQGNYEEFNRRCPKLGKKYETNQGTVKVLRANMFSQSIVILTDAGEEKELLLEEWDAYEPHRAEPVHHDSHKGAHPRSGETGRKAKSRAGQGGPKPAHDEAAHPRSDQGKDKPSGPTGDSGHKPQKRRRQHEE